MSRSYEFVDRESVTDPAQVQKLSVALLERLAADNGGTITLSLTEMAYALRGQQVVDIASTLYSLRDDGIVSEDRWSNLVYPPEPDAQ